MRSKEKLKTFFCKKFIENFWAYKKTSLQSQR